MESDNMLSLIGIDNLNDDCLMHIFHYLPIVDRIRLQRVCQRWYVISKMSWKTFKKISTDRSLWGVNSKSKISIDYDILKKIINLCGPFITHVDLSFDDDYYVQPDHIIRFQSCKNIINLIHAYCPKVTYIHLGRPCSISTIETVNLLFGNLTHFSIKMVNEQYEDSLSGLFVTVRTLKFVSLVDCSLAGYCFKYLNPDVIEELHLMSTSIDTCEYLVSILDECKKLRSLSIIRCYIKQTERINPILHAISFNAETLRNIDLHFVYRYVEPVKYINMSNFKHLQRLRLSGNVLVTDEFLAIIGSNCTELTELVLTESRVLTDAGILEITRLPLLWNLELKLLDIITGRYLNEMPHLRILECHRCPSIRKENLSRLLETSEIIESLKLHCCDNLRAEDFFDTVINSKVNKLLVYNNTSEIENYLFLHKSLVIKFFGHIIKKKRKHCYICFKTNRNDNNCGECCNIKEKFLIS